MVFVVILSVFLFSTKLPLSMWFCWLYKERVTVVILPVSLFSTKLPLSLLQVQH